MDAKHNLQITMSLMQDFGAMYIEDPFMRINFMSWHTFNKKFGKKLIIVGDDLLLSKQKLKQKLPLVRVGQNAVIKT